MVAHQQRSANSGERTRLARKRPAFVKFEDPKDCFGEPPKPAREPRALPRMLCSIVVGLYVLLISHSLAAEVIPPKPDGYFNDYAGVVSKDAASRFNEQLAQFERETSDQVVVAVFPKMQSDSDIADYTQRVAQAWGVGQKERRNGVVLFVFTQDRKMFIQVGYGLEGALPDATAFDITERHIKPLFRTGNYEAGLATGIDLICKAIRGEYKGSGKTVTEGKGGGAVYRSFALHHLCHCALHAFAAVPKIGRLRLFIARRWACVYPERRRLVVRWWRQWRRIQRVRRWRRQFRRRRRGIELVIKCERENSLANSSTTESFRRFTKLNRKRRVRFAF